MPDLDAEKSSYGSFERFLFFATPVIFTIVLTGVLFTLFDKNMMNTVLRAVNQVPFLEKYVPDPVKIETRTTAAAESALRSGMPAQPSDAAAELEAVKAQLADRDARLAEALLEAEQKEKKVSELESEIAALKEQLRTKTQSDEEYRQRIQQLASIYAGMLPSRAAPILESLTLKERVLVLNEMKPENKSKILEKMSPQIAAETSIQMKDIVPAKDLQIAALQERLEVQKDAERQAESMDRSQLGQTFSNMLPKSAATILVQLNSASPDRALDILKAMDSQSRANVLAAIAESNKQTAAALAAKLAE
jgi:flagellar motility protein MotE (MotC chaperone)